MSRISPKKKWSLFLENTPSDEFIATSTRVSTSFDEDKTVKILNF